jgi:hypothetical protein
MILQLSVDDITQNWESIKFGAMQVGAVAEKNIPKASRALLESLLRGTHQAWACLEAGQIKTVIITRIHQDAFGHRHILIETAYGFSPATVEDKMEYIEELNKFGINQGMVGGTISALTNNPMAANAMRKMGMAEAYKVFSRDIGYNAALIEEK